MGGRKVSWWQDALWRIEAAAFAGYESLFRLLPIDWASALGGALMRTLGPLNSAHRTARANIDIAFPEASPEWKRRLLADQWENFGRVFAEFPSLDRLIADPSRIEIVNGERLDEIAASQTPVVFISGHFANWELMPAAILRHGVRCLITYRPTNNPYVDQRIRETRFRYGVRLFAPKGESARELIEGLASGESVALMNDQKFNEGLMVDFFGVPAATAQGPTRMALKFGLKLQPMSVTRLSGARFRVTVHEPITIADTGHRALDIEAGVRAVNAFVEQRVREHPSDWFWVHKRWPNAHYPKRERPRRWGFSLLQTGLIAGLVLLVAAAVIWRDDIRRTFLDPKVPFQIYQPPPAPDYGSESAWALLPQGSRAPGPADIFFVHPTTYDGGDHWNAPIDHAAANEQLRRVMLPNYAGPFQTLGRLYAPRYRQASLYSHLTGRDDAREARIFAYGDVARAFAEFQRLSDPARPLIVVGVGQGALLADRLMAEALEQTPVLAERLVAVYLIDSVVPADEHGPDALLPACQRRDQAGCLVAWAQVAENDDEMRRLRLERASIWDGAGRLVVLGSREALCVNPLLGAQSEVVAGPRLSLGAANATDVEWGVRPAFLSRQVEAVCRDGLLIHSVPRSPSLKPSGTWADRRKSPPYNLFYADIEADAEARLAAFRGRPTPDQSP